MDSRLLTIDYGLSTHDYGLMTTSSKFNTLPLHHKAPIVWREGKFTETISYYGYQVSLYAVYDFFVEVYYSQDQNAIEKIEAVDDRALTKFLSRINLRDLE